MIYRYIILSNDDNNVLRSLGNTCIKLKKLA